MSARQSAAVDRALKRIAKGSTPYAAAKKEGLALSTVYRAVKRNNEKSGAALLSAEQRPVHRGRSPATE